MYWWCVVEVFLFFEGWGTIIIIREIQRVKIIKDSLIESKTNKLEGSNQPRLWFSIRSAVMIPKPSLINKIGVVLAALNTRSKGKTSIIIMSGLSFLLRLRFLLCE